MNRFKLSFAAVIAIVAIGLTITASAGIFKNTALAPEDFCYTSLSSRLTCATAPNVPLSPLTCVQATPYAANKAIFAIAPASRFPVADISVNCINNDVFCCAELAVTPQLCSAQPKVTIDGVNDYFKITAIHCKAQ